MLKPPCKLLIKVINRPEIVNDISLREWDELLPIARSAELMGVLAARVFDAGYFQEIPLQVAKHLESAKLVVEAHEKSVIWEIKCLLSVFKEIGIPLVLLKGAAYVVKKLPPCRGRLFNDVDILVPRDTLNDVEQALMLHGWASTHLHSYDQRYYREWMHELPPMKHYKRKSVLDVHHNILPETARYHPSAEKLLATAQTVDENPRLLTLADTDIVLHSATHLFHEGEFKYGLRDLVDLDSLLCRFSEKESFWMELLERARELDLSRPLYYGLRYTHRIIGTPVPEFVLEQAKIGRPSWLMSKVMDGLFMRGLMPLHRSCDSKTTGFARWLLYIRSHYLRMPFRLLIPHLLRKAVRQSDSH